jgi:hypothetical protein
LTRRYTNARRLDPVDANRRTAPTSLIKDFEVCLL